MFVGVLHLKVKRSENKANKMSFFEQMRYFFVVFILFGVWTPWEGNIYRCKLQVYSLFSMALAMLDFIGPIILNKFYENNSLSNIMGNALFLSMATTHLVIIVESIVKNEAQLKLIEKFSLVDNVFNVNLDQPNAFQQEKCAIFIQISILFLFGLLIKIVVIYFQSIFSIEYNFWHFVIYPEVLICLRSIQIIYFVYLLRCAMRGIHKVLVDIEEQLEQEIDVEREPATKIPNQSVYDRLLSVKIIYDELHDICLQINAIFGWSLVFIFTQKFIHITSNSFWIFINFLNGTPPVIIGVIVSDVATLFSLTFNCSSCSRSVMLSLILSKEY